MRLLRSVLVLAFAVLASARPLASFSEQRETPPSVAEIEAFIGAKLPHELRDLRAVDEAGIDRLMRLRFDASEAEAAGFAAAVLPGGLKPGFDPGMIMFGSGLDWWIEAVPSDAVGGDAVSATNRTYKLVSIPTGPGRRRVWLAVFTQ